MKSIFLRRLYGAIRFFPLSVMCTLFVSTGAMANEWNSWVATQIIQHPDVLAAKERWQGAVASTDANDQPLYNPEISAGIERNGDDNNFDVGLQQTVDLWDRREAYAQQSTHTKNAAMYLYQQQILDKTAEVITALVEWQNADKAAVIARAQQTQLNEMLELVDVRQQSGDLGTTDAQLAFLSLSQQITQVAEIESNLLQAEIRLKELLPQWQQSKGGIPTVFWPRNPPSVSEEKLKLHPQVASAEAMWLSLKGNTESTRRAAKADPTFGINAGRDGGNGLIGLTVSIPLHVRNDFSSETRAAQKLEVEAQEQWMATFRQQRAAWNSAKTSWQVYAHHLTKWQALLANRVENSKKLLEQQWQSGDLSTSDYLLALNQRTDSLLAGIELEKQTQLALTEVLYQSGHLTTIIKPLN